MLLAVGGQSRNVGKTSVVAGLIRALRDWQWTAVKITQYGHGVCSHVGEACGCEAEPDHPFSLSEEYAASGADSGRFLAAGARRSFWLRTRAGELACAADTLGKILAQNADVIVESNSVLEVARPDLFLMVLDFSCQDFKPSALRFLDRVDAFVVIDRGAELPKGAWDTRAKFLVTPPDYVTHEIAEFVTRARASVK